MTTLKQLFGWRYSPNVLKNRGDIIVPINIAKRLPKEININFDGNVYRLKIDPRGRLRGVGCKNAIFIWLSKANIAKGYFVPVYYNNSEDTLIFDSANAYQTND